MGYNAGYIHDKKYIVDELVNIFNIIIQILADIPIDNKFVLVIKDGKIENFVTIDGVLNVLTPMCFVKDLQDMLDCNWNLLPFLNGVYDFQLDVLRDYNQEDLITTTINHCYIPYLKTLLYNRSIPRWNYRIGQKPKV